MPIEQYHQYLATALLLLVTCAAVNDLATRRIPNRLLLAGLACALVLHGLSAAPLQALASAATGLATGLAIFLPFYLLRGMAAGDVKLMAVIGAFTGPYDAFVIAILSWCAGGVMAVVLILARGRLRLALGNLGRMLMGFVAPAAALAAPMAESAGTMPYGVAIAAGTIAFLLHLYG